MRTVFLIICMIISFSSISQIKQDEMGAIYFEKVYEVPNLSQGEIKNAVNEWIALNFNDANHVIKMNTDNKIINKGLTKSFYEWTGVVVDLTNEFDMISEFKDGRFRLTINNITYKTPNGSPHNITWNKTPIEKEEFKKNFSKMIDEMDPGQVKRINERMLKSEKKFNEHYENMILAREKIYDAVVLEIESITISLSDFVKDKSKSNDSW